MDFSTASNSAIVSKFENLSTQAALMIITINKQLRLDQVPEALAHELTRQLQFVNPKWLENERMRRWNRGTPKILKFIRKTHNGTLYLPRGFMGRLVLLCRRHGHTFTIEDKRRSLSEIDLIFRGRLKPFQLQAVEAMLKKDFGTLSAPTGSGKTVMALAMAARRRQPTLIVVHTKELAAQWMARIATFLDVDQEQIGFIGGGKKNVGRKITVAMVQSLYKCAGEIAAGTGHLVVDECHRAPSRTFTEAVKAFDARYMLGLSATPWRRDRLSKLIYWYLGDVHHEVQRAGLVAQGDILGLEVIQRPTDFTPYYDPVNEYSRMLSELCNNDQRNRLIAADIAREIDRTGNGAGEAFLVLSDRRQHCLVLHALLKHLYRIPAAVLTGDLSMEQRRGVIQDLEQGRVKVLIATGQLIGEGFDCPHLSVLFLTTPVRFSGRVLQYLGRVLRPVEGIERARVYDYVDERVPSLAAAARARLRVYEQGH